jgi:hypothetical protein
MLFFDAQCVMHLSTYARAVTHSTHTELIPPVNFVVGRNCCLKGFSEIPFSKEGMLVPPSRFMPSSCYTQEQTPNQKKKKKPPKDWTTEVKINIDDAFSEGEGARGWFQNYHLDHDAPRSIRLSWMQNGRLLSCSIPRLFSHFPRKSKFEESLTT